MKSTMRIKLKEKDIDYDKYIGISRIIEVFDDIAQELLIRNKGHRGVLKEYEELEFIKPLVYGDYLDVIGQIIAFNETTLKIKYTGEENILEIKSKLEDTIKQNKDTENSNNTDNLAGILSKTPTIIVKSAVNLFRFLDKHGLLPKFIINASPFHTSAFLTNVGSLGIDTIYHHLYNFGTTSMFFAMGKKKKSYIYEDDEIRKEKCITIAFVGDERICDGYYYASSFRSFIKYLNHPELLEQHGVPKKDVD